MINKQSGTFVWYFHSNQTKVYINIQGGDRGVMVIVVGYGHGNTSSNPGRD